MAARRYVLGLILVLGILVSATAAANSKEASPRPEAEPSKTVLLSSKEDARKEKNKKLLDGMNKLSKKLDGLLKKSPDFSGS